MSIYGIESIYYHCGFPPDGLVDGHVHVQHEHVQPERLQRGCRRGGRPESDRRGRPVPADPTPQETRALHAGTGLRAGAAVQAAEVPLGARRGTPGQPDPPHAHAGQDLVPEPSLQSASGRRRRRRWPSSSSRSRRVKEGRRAGAREGRQAVLDGLRRGRQRRHDAGRRSQPAVDAAPARTATAAPSAAGLRRGCAQEQLPGCGVVRAELGGGGREGARPRPVVDVLPERRGSAAAALQGALNGMSGYGQAVAGNLDLSAVTNAAMCPSYLQLQGRTW
ncbi:hypothetical protein CEXT_120721 [Caerostris extrusa]|uniref:Uncharacterized protein n=1 Tax=Caerostris extrusa TaxID=172846 RepID=A0AAV4X057_CAEEX|nr:hypothetical protein CEXT_120721 [Caerostris extrusa]